MITLPSNLVVLFSLTAVASCESSCPLWLAPSYITELSTESPKYGLYAGVEYPQNATLPLSELAIPLIDFFGDFNRAKKFGSDTLSFLENFLWTQEKIGSMWEGNISSPAIIPGIGVLANYHSTYSNADFLQAAILLRETEHEFQKPREATLLRGSVTPYFNVTLKATQNIPAGMEIFADYGDVWDENFTENIYQDRIHRYDYNTADKLVNKLVDLYENNPEISLDTKEDIMDFMLRNVLTTVAGPNAKTINSLIPENPRKLKKVKEAGGTFMYRYQDMIRSHEWLKENGFCLDTLRAGVSQIPNAGRGAFANRDIKYGEIITITPLIHIADKNLLTMYPIEFELNDEMDGAELVYSQRDGPIGKQILLNYAFGHPESSMVFVPTAPQVTLINNDGKSANAIVKWAESDDPLTNPEEYLNFSVEQMAEVKESVLVMKVVATRDISEGEEITLDYGNSWETAWNAYEKSWKENKEGKPHPLKAEDLRIIYKNKPLETPETIGENPYPDDILTACFLSTTERRDGTQMVDQDSGTDIKQFAMPSRYEDYDSKSLYVVDVLNRNEAPGYFFNYTVRAMFLGAQNEDEDDEDAFADVVDVPHAACTFFDSQYSSDIHMPGAFRHPIGMPQSEFPISWRNLR